MNPKDVTSSEIRYGTIQYLKKEKKKKRKKPGCDKPKQTLASTALISRKVGRNPKKPRIQIRNRWPRSASFYQCVSAAGSVFAKKETSATAALRPCRIHAVIGDPSWHLERTRGRESESKRQVEIYQCNFDKYDPCQDPPLPCYPERPGLVSS